MAWPSFCDARDQDFRFLSSRAPIHTDTLSRSCTSFAAREISLSRCGMPQTPIANDTPSQNNRKPSCAVCWQDFVHPRELDDHIRQGHPDRIIDQDELFVRAS